MRQRLVNARSVGIRHIASYYTEASDKSILALLQVQIMPLPPVQAGSTVLESSYEAYSEVEPQYVEGSNVSVVNMPNVGKGLEVITREYLQSSTREISQVEILTARFVFPLTDMVISLNFMTPNMDEAVPLIQLFELIASSLDVTENRERKE
ncbi:hypothetical protein [Alloscardovia venturai]